MNQRPRIEPFRLFRGRQYCENPKRKLHMESLRYEIQPAPGETERGAHAIAQAAMPPSRANLVLFSIYGLCAFLAYFLTPSTSVTTFLIGFISVSLTVSLLNADVRFRLRSLRRSDAHALETRFVELSPEGVGDSCSHIDSRYPWQDFMKIIVTPEFYLFVRPSGLGSSIPRRVLDASEETRLQQCVRAWSPDAAIHIGFQER